MTHLQTSPMLQRALRVAATAFYSMLQDPENAYIVSWRFDRLATIKSRDDSVWDTGSGWRNPAHTMGYIATTLIHFAVCGSEVALLASIAMLADGRPTAIQFTLVSYPRAHILLHGIHPVAGKMHFIVRQRGDGFVLSLSNF